MWLKGELQRVCLAVLACWMFVFVSAEVDKVSPVAIPKHVIEGGEQLQDDPCDLGFIFMVHFSSSFLVDRFIFVTLWGQKGTSSVWLST